MSFPLVSPVMGQYTLYRVERGSELPPLLVLECELPVEGTMGTAPLFSVRVCRDLLAGEASSGPAGGMA